MSVLSKHGSELYRYLSDKSNAALIAVMSDGTRHILRAGGTWKLLSTRKPEVPLSTWRENKMKVKAKIQELEPWRLKVKSLPTMVQIMKWMDDKGKCKTATGEWVEPDGTGSDGAPTWAYLFGLI